MCSHSRIVWRWIELTLVWTLGLGVIVLGHFPNPAQLAGGAGLQGLANLQGAMVLMILASTSSVLALYALFITTPLWLLAELLAWKRKPVIATIEPDAGSREEYQGGKHGWVPRGN